MSLFDVVPLIIVATITYLGNQLMKRHLEKKDVILLLVLLGLTGQLALFKFVIISLPIGISYYTFMGIGYTIDVYRGTLQPTALPVEHAAFMAFLPVIISGPILRAKDFFSQLHNRVPDLQQGVTLISIGLIMKFVIADNLAIFADPIFANPLKFGSKEIIFATFAFGIQLYCDFGGYCNIALGIAQILGFRFPANFNMPYLALSPQDFWRRWNISLSSWLRDYLYIPLGGNRKGELRTHVNLILTMVICGLWHGATLNFLAWGIYHGALLSVNRLIRFPESRMLSIAGMLLTQYLIFLGWLVFRVSDPKNLTYCLSKFLVPTGFSTDDIALGIIAIAAILLARGVLIDRDLIRRISVMRPASWAIYLVIALLVTYWASPVKYVPFIYAGF